MRVDHNHIPLMNSQAVYIILNRISSQIVLYTNLWVQLSLNIIQLIYHKHMVKISLLDLKLLKFAGDKLPPWLKICRGHQLFYLTFSLLIPIPTFNFNFGHSIFFLTNLVSQHFNLYDKVHYPYLYLFLFFFTTHTNTNIYTIFAQDLKWSQSVELMDSSSMQKKKRK